MIDVDSFYKIKHLYHKGHFRVGQIAEQLHLDVGTVSKWIQRDAYRRRTEPRRSGKLDAYKASFKSLTKSSLERHKNPQDPANPGLYRRHVDSYGFHPHEGPTSPNQSPGIPRILLDA